MFLRKYLVATVLLACGPAWAAPTTRPAPRPVLAKSPPALMTFYVVRGSPDACGPGCSNWLAVEGQVDSGAAARFRKFLRQVRDRGLPIYFSSPGGNLDQALAMGAMLREKPVVARVARTVVDECGFEAQDSDVCMKLKQSGRELHGDLQTRGAMCNSACPYLILGATVREIAPDVGLAVHSPKVVLNFRGGVPTPEMRAAATQRSLARADHMLSNYIFKMGANPGLLALANSIKFEDTHVLSREEIARFGIDARPFSETAWTLEPAPRPYIRKFALARKDNATAFRTMEWRLFCENKDRARLMYVRETDPGAATVSSVIMMAGPERSVALKFPARVGRFEVWSDTIAPDPMKAMLRAPRLQVGEGTLTPDGKTSLASFDIDTVGLQSVWTQLLASCPVAPAGARPVAAWPGLGRAPTQ